MLDPSRIQIEPLRGRAVMRIQSWTPVHAIEIAGRAFSTEAGATLATDPKVLCLGPCDWLAISQTLSPPVLLNQLEAEATRQDLVVVDVSQGMLIFEVRGLSARELLSKGCGLDMHPGAFRVGQCARTRFAQIPVVIDCLDAPSRFELYVARSYGAYLHGWLRDAAVEFLEGAE